MNESKPYMNPPNKHISQVDPMWEVTSKYYIDRMWQEYHKMKEELADTKCKLGQSEDYISEVLKPELADAKLKLKMAHSAWDELDKSHAERAKLHDELVIAEGQRDQAKMRAETAEAELYGAKLDLAEAARHIGDGNAFRAAMRKELEAVRAQRDSLDKLWSDAVRELQRIDDERIQVVAERDALRKDAAEKDRVIYLTRWEDRTKQLDECIEAAEKMRIERDVFKGEVKRLSAELAIANGWEDTRARCS